jgi:hypothetical protein
MMMMKKITPRDWENLSAYLDGQLAVKERQKLEGRLAADQDLQVALEGMRRTRSVLRSQPHMRAPRNFTLSPEMAGLLGGVLINLLAQLVIERARPARDEPAPATRLTLIVDEFQTIPSGDYRTMLSQLAKFGVNLALATQTLTALEPIRGAAGRRGRRSSPTPAAGSASGRPARHRRAVATALGGGLTTGTSTACRPTTATPAGRSVASGHQPSWWCSTHHQPVTRRWPGRWPTPRRAGMAATGRRLPPGSRPRPDTASHRQPPAGHHGTPPSRSHPGRHRRMSTGAPPRPSRSMPPARRTGGRGLPAAVVVAMPRPP